MIESYLNQSVLWKVQTGVNEYNEPTFSAGTTIKAQLEYKRKLVRKPTSEEVISEATVLCNVPVRAGDIIEADGLTFNVLVSSPKRDFLGVVSHYEVSL